jgi:hypothetical protein
MYHHGYQLQSEADFDNAIFFGNVVSITLEGEHVGSGRILAQSRHVITTANANYYKKACEFTVCKLTMNWSHNT